MKGCGLWGTNEQGIVWGGFLGFAEEERRTVVETGQPGLEEK